MRQLSWRLSNAICHDRTKPSPLMRQPFAASLTRTTDETRRLPTPVPTLRRYGGRRFVSAVDREDLIISVLLFSGGVSLLVSRHMVQELPGAFVADLRKKLSADCEFVAKHPSAFPVVYQSYETLLSKVPGAAGASMLVRLREAAGVTDTTRVSTLLLWLCRVFLHC